MSVQMRDAMLFAANKSPEHVLAAAFYGAVASYDNATAAAISRRKAAQDARIQRIQHDDAVDAIQRILGATSVL